MNKFIVALIFIFISSQLLAADTCMRGQIKIKTFGVEKIEKTKYCFNDTKNILYSTSCKKGKCLNLKLFNGLVYGDLFSQYGNPGFSLCTKIGGDAQIIEFYADKEWHALDRCIIRKNSFLDTGLLLKYFRDIK